MPVNDYGQSLALGSFVCFLKSVVSAVRICRYYGSKIATKAIADGLFLYNGVFHGRL